MKTRKTVMAILAVLSSRHLKSFNSFCYSCSFKPQTATCSNRKSATCFTHMTLSGAPTAARTRGLSLRRRTLYPTELWMQGTVLPLVFSAIARFLNQTHADRRRQNRYKTRASQSFDRLPSKSLFDFPDELRNQMTFHPADFFLSSSPKYYRGNRMKSQFI